MTTTVQDPSLSTYLPVPRVPQRAEAPWPSVDLLESVAPDAAEVVAQARAVREELAGAVAELEGGRPGGAAWRAAREADRAVVLSTDKRRTRTGNLASLMAGEHERYARCLALASAVSERLDDLRAQLATDTLIKAVDKRRAVLADELAHAAEDAYTAAAEDKRSAGWTALERFDGLAVESRQLTGLRAWLVGESDAFTVPRAAAVPTDVYRWQSEARALLTEARAAS